MDSVPTDSVPTDPVGPKELGRSQRTRFQKTRSVPTDSVPTDSVSPDSPGHIGLDYYTRLGLLEFVYLVSLVHNGLGFTGRSSTGLFYS
jgi:hypothetical protein